MDCKKILSEFVANFGKNAKKKMFNDKFITTFEILMTAYFIGRLSALILEKGIIANASKAKIQRVKTMYSILNSDQNAKSFLKSNNTAKNIIVDQNIEMVAVEMTLFLLDSEL